jgi:hypothetical protein
MSKQKREAGELLKQSLRSAIEQSNNELIIECLKERNFDSLDDKGNGPLHYAVMREYTKPKALKDVIEYLINAANTHEHQHILTHKNNEGKTALDIANEKGLAHIAQLITDALAKAAPTVLPTPAPPTASTTTVALPQSSSDRATAPAEEEKQPQTQFTLSPASLHDATPNNDVPSEVQVNPVAALPKATPSNTTAHAHAPHAEHTHSPQSNKKRSTTGWALGVAGGLCLVGGGALYFLLESIWIAAGLGVLGLGLVIAGGVAAHHSSRNRQISQQSNESQPQQNQNREVDSQVQHNWFTSNPSVSPTINHSQQPVSPPVKKQRT